MSPIVWVGGIVTLVVILIALWMLFRVRSWTAAVRSSTVRTAVEGGPLDGGTIVMGGPAFLVSVKGVRGRYVRSDGVWRWEGWERP